MADDKMLPTAEELQDLLLECPGFPEFLLGLATLSAAFLGGDAPMLCAITVERDGGPFTVVSSTDYARTLDERQYDLGVGPCLTALREQRTVLIQDLRSDDQWHRYADLVSESGIRAVLAVPIRTDSGSRSALNCYSMELGTFTPEAVGAIERHADSMSRILRLALRLHLHDSYPDPLRSILKQRATVDAAIALIMMQNRCSREFALKLIYIASRNSNSGLQEIAADILTNAGIEDREY